MKNKTDYMIDTDVLLDHLKYKGEGFSFLEKLMMTGICFTTVINATELFLLATNTEQNIAVKNLLSALKVLGLHARYALSANEYNNYNMSVRDVMFATAASINKLAIVTLDFQKYKSIEVKIYHPTELI